MEKNQIREFLKDAKKTAVIGIGSELLNPRNKERQIAPGAF